MNADAYTPLATYHEDIRVILEDKDHEIHPAYELNRAIVAVLRLGEVPGFKISPDGQSVEPKLTSEFNQDSYALLVKSTALKFPKSLTKDQIFNLKCEIDELRTYGS
jgi:hypothetical protein